VDGRNKSRRALNLGDDVMSDVADNAKKVGIPAAATLAGAAGGLVLLGPIGAVIGGGVALGVAVAAVVKKAKEKG
jgi:uncharacterized membrane protein